MVNCYQNKKFKIHLKVKKNNCIFALKDCCVYSFEELMPQGLCFLAFHAAYPYYLTLKDGGWFTWVKPKEDVVVQCANPEGSLEMKVFLHRAKNEVRIEILGVRGVCPKGYKKGDVFILNDAAFKFCPHALISFFPYIKLLLEGERLAWMDNDGRAILQCAKASCAKSKFSIEISE